MKVSMILVITFILISETAGAEFTFHNELIQDLYDDRTLVSSRFSILRAFETEIYGKGMTLSPYIEGTYDFNLDEFSKVEAGLTLEMSLLRYLFFSLSGQCVSVSGRTCLVEQYVSTNSDSQDIELIGELGFRIPLPFRMLVFSGAETYIFEVEGMRGTRNELTAAIEAGFLPIGVGLRWRHLDTIHGPDTDELALTFSLVF